MLQTLHIISILTMFTIGLINMIPDEILLTHVKPLLTLIFTDVQTVVAVREKTCLLLVSSIASIGVAASIRQHVSLHCLQDFFTYGQCPCNSALANVMAVQGSVDQDIQLEDVSFLLHRRSRPSVGTVGLGQGLPDVELVVCDSKGSSCKVQDSRGHDHDCVEHKLWSSPDKGNVNDVKHEEEELDLDDLNRVHTADGIKKEKPKKKALDLHQFAAKMTGQVSQEDTQADPKAPEEQVEQVDISYLHGKNQQKPQAKMPADVDGGKEEDKCEIVEVGTEQLRKNSDN